MSTHKSIDRICCVLIVLALLLTGVMVYGKATGVETAERTMGYEARLFDTGKVHTIDIQMDDWDSFIASCEDEAYAACTVIIDNEVSKNVAIRAKGNTSLSNVAQLGSQRYSFKIEFDHYETGKTYHGLDKLSLNNLIQDNTMMKDYLSYQLMDRFGVNAPLASYVYLTVNGEDWGLYLAVEGIEDAFLARNYGGEGELYKPDSMEMGGGRGNGRDFDMTAREQGSETTSQSSESAKNVQGWNNPMGGRGQMNGEMPMEMPEGMTGMDGQMPGGRGQMSGEMPMEMPEGMTGMDGQMPGGRGQMNGEMPMEMPEGMTGMDGQMPGDMDTLNGEMPAEMPDGMGGLRGGMFSGMGGMGGNGSADVKLQYIDDDPESYSNIFDNGKTDTTEADRARLISSLKSLSEGENIPEVVDTEAVIRYFVVHNFLCNGDSYTGSMIHNYYLYENDGKLSMLPWDYNLAFGGFQSFDASSTVNEPIDSPVSGGSAEDRPMIAWIFDDAQYQQRYHKLFTEFLDTVDIVSMIDAAAELISPYVERDPSKFCTHEEFEKGVDTLRTFCSLRAESIRGQLGGTIPSTTEGQTANSSTLIDASGITISDMGSMQQGMGGRMNPSQAGMNAGFVSGKEEMPEMDFPVQNGEIPAGGFMPQNDERNPFTQGHMENSIGMQTWLVIGVSAAALLLGLLITCYFRRK